MCHHQGSAEGGTADDEMEPMMAVAVEKKLGLCATLGTHLKWADLVCINIHPKVVFRYHHSIADGIAIFRLFCKDFIDKTTTDVTNVWKYDSADKRSLWRIIGWKNVFRVMIRGPCFLVNELFLKREDNPFHGSKPSMDKIICWGGETPAKDVCSAPLISVIKKVKLLTVGCSFTDVFLTALAMSLRSYFKRKSVHIPESITVARMQRFQRESKAIRLSNRSTGVFQTLPIADLPIAEAKLTTISKLVSQINAVKDSNNNKMQSFAEALISFFSVSYLPELLPARIMRAIFAQSKFSIALSNIPAFESAISVENYFLKEAAFWVPNIEHNMFGVSVLTTNGRLQIGLIADRKIMPHEEDLEIILQGTFKQLENMHNILQRSAQ
ncbi:uncharacterized protein LOC128730235 [Anopheles nili]|uniref:uncharacterized protein LOC128730235 n=1 Tax=Anopheles nili TaxID=185578 RepID=UPI00237AAAE4|nr:uncharacterized protein LOC128730235 [Anopheles nili]